MTTHSTPQPGDVVSASGYLATVVAHRPDLGGYVVAMLGRDEDGPDGCTPGEQFVIPAAELRLASVRVQITALQASWLADLDASGSESYGDAVALGVHVDDDSGLLIVPRAAFRALGTAVGIRADIADEGEYSIGERRSILGLARKLAAAGVTGAAPLAV